jgi:PAS domain S-box-containing protein
MEYISEGVRGIVGYSPQDLCQPEGPSWAEIIHPDDQERVWKEVQQAVNERRSFELTYRVRTTAGEERWVWERGQGLVSSAGEVEVLEGFVTDVTKQRMTEEQLRQSQKMEAVGQLTGGVAHDFNNLLTVILGNAELLTEEPSDPALTYTLAQQILETAERGADLNQKLLAFGRRQSLKPERLKAETVVNEMVPLLYRTIGEHIELRTEHGATQYCALTDRTLLESAVLNLAVNARDAMPRGGMLTIETGERLAGQGDGSLPIGQPVVYVCVSDTGTGMTPEVLKRVFEPFFTTKDTGKGSGLGLSMVVGFAEQSAGHVSIESKVGEGTTVTIVLPGILAGTLPATHEDTKAPTAGPRGAKVLLVEDEQPVLEYVSGQLTSLGYQVTAVSTGREALDLLQQVQCFDLLFTDVVLPKGLSGVQVAQRASQLCPQIKVLLTSGYPEEVFQQHGTLPDDTILLRKPYRRKELERILAVTLTTAA